MKKMLLIPFMILAFQQVQATDWNYVCKALGEIRQCENVSVCREEVTSSTFCQAKAHLKGTQWEDLCPKAGHNELACGWQKSHCEWKHTTFRSCVPDSY